MTLSGPASRPVEAGDYPYFDVVVSSSVTVDRNLRGRLFPHALSRDEAAGLGERLCSAARSCGFEVARVGELDAWTRSNLAERELYSRPYLLDEANYVALSPRKALWLAVNDADHLSIRTRRPGLDLARAWDDASEADDSLADALEGAPWAFDADIGYIMSEVAYCGSGLEARVVIHAPALVASGLAETAFKRAIEAGFIVAGAYSSVGASGGALFELSLPRAYRDPETAALDRLGAAARALSEYERRAREDLLARSPWDILDVIGRAVGKARCSRLVSRDEAADVASGLRLGLACGALEGMGLESATELWSALRVRPYGAAAGSGDPAGRDPVPAAEEPEAALRARSLRRAASSIGFTQRYNDV